MAIDPVCGMTVDEKSAATTRVYAATTFYFCSEHCGAQFDTDPAGYLNKTRPMPPLKQGHEKGPKNVACMIWGSLTMLTCPCCIPIWIFLLAGTAAGALLAKNLYLTVAAFSVPFVFFAWKAFRSYGRKKIQG